ncbi:MAG: hypothetical protein U0974_16505 [Gemmatimonadales bacterium]|nr:hypothetical protein [Gemmatimonadales bacterium]MDZ4391328.1 hypothetical protein [Gemmatimonadales bacterium]
MHTRLRLMALGVVLLGGGASLAEEAEAKEACADLTIFMFDANCPAYNTLWDACEAAFPDCGTPSTVFCSDGSSAWPHYEIWCSWQYPA